MANRDKGEVSIQVGETSYTLVMSVKGMMAAEAAASTSTREVFWDDIVLKMSKGSATNTLFYVWAMFQEHHPTMSLADVQRVVDALGVGFDGLKDAIEAGRTAATPDPEDIKALGVNHTKRPRKARGAGTGGNSISPPVASA